MLLMSDVPLYTLTPPGERERESERERAREGERKIERAACPPNLICRNAVRRPPVSSPNPLCE